MSNKNKKNNLKINEKNKILDSLVDDNNNNNYKKKTFV